jgi:hypothetical protein
MPPNPKPETAPDGSNSGNGAAAAGPPTDRYRVRLSHPLDRRRIVFSSVSANRARKFVANRFPRGSEAYLELPDGSAEHYEHERTGPYGEDVDQWQPFDPDSYKPPEEAEPPGQSAWADVES